MATRLLAHGCITKLLSDAGHILTMAREGRPESVLIHDGAEIRHADATFLALIGADSRDQVVGHVLTEYLTSSHP